MAKKRSAVHEVLKDVRHCAPTSDGPQFLSSELLESGELLLHFSQQVPRPDPRGGRRDARTGPKPVPLNVGTSATGRSSPHATRECR